MKASDVALAYLCKATLTEPWNDVVFQRVTIRRLRSRFTLRFDVLLEKFFGGIREGFFGPSLSHSPGRVLADGNRSKMSGGLIAGLVNRQRSIPSDRHEPFRSRPDGHSRAVPEDESLPTGRVDTKPEPGQRRVPDHISVRLRLGQVDGPFR